VSDFEGVNGDELTLEEVKAIRAMARLSKTWPQTLKLVSMGGGLHVVHTDDERFHHHLPAVRGEAILYSFEQIPNDGGDW
jgi:diaminopimelate decarboxylase